MTTVAGPKRALEPLERQRLLSLDRRVPRLPRDPGYRSNPVRNASSPEYEVTRRYVASLLSDQVSPAEISTALHLSVSSVRLWGKAVRAEELCDA